MYKKFQNFKIVILFLLLFSVDRIEAQEIKTKLGGRLLLDGITYINSDDTLANRFNIVDLRLTSKIYIDSSIYCKIDVGFARNKVAIKDAFVQYNRRENYFRAGYMFGFFGLDQSTSTNDFVFNTGAGVAELFYPGRRVGLSYTCSTIHYYLSNGLFFSDGLISDGDALKNGFNTSLRFVWRPINEECKLLHVGLSGFYKIPDVNKVTTKRRIELSGSGITYLQSPELIHIDLEDVKYQVETGVECYAFKDKWMIQGEYMRMLVNNNCKNFRAQGGYCQIGYLIKGNHYGYDQTDAVPIMPSDKNSLMIVARYNVTRLEYSDNYECGHITFNIGVNYYLNKHISGKINYTEECNVRNLKLAYPKSRNIQIRLQFTI